MRRFLAAQGAHLCDFSQRIICLRLSLHRKTRLGRQSLRAVRIKVELCILGFLGHLQKGLVQVAPLEGALSACRNECGATWHLIGRTGLRRRTLV